MNSVRAAQIRAVFGLDADLVASGTRDEFLKTSPYYREVAALAFDEGGE